MPSIASMAIILILTITYTYATVQQLVSNHGDNNNKMDNLNKSHPQINIPSFKDDMNNSHQSYRSAIVSNYEDNTPVNSVNYDNYPSWHSQFDSHTSQCSYSTNISEHAQPLPSYNQSKSFNYNNNIRREYVSQKSLYKGISYLHSIVWLYLKYTNKYIYIHIRST